MITLYPVKTPPHQSASHFPPPLPKLCKKKYEESKANKRRKLILISICCYPLPLPPSVMFLAIKLFHFPFCQIFFLTLSFFSVQLCIVSYRPATRKAIFFLVSVAPFLGSFPSVSFRIKCSCHAPSNASRLLFLLQHQSNVTNEGKRRKAKKETKEAKRGKRKKKRGK